MPAETDTGMSLRRCLGSAQKEKKKKKKKKKKKTTPFGVNLMRSQVLYWAAQGCAEKYMWRICEEMFYEQWSAKV